jgi:nucleotide-binding universal stress UspA family protein
MEVMMSVFSNIVCCINLSENPDDVAQYVNDITRQNEAKLILVHVAADSEAVLRRTGSKSMVEKLIEESRKANEEAFTAYVNKHFAGLDVSIVLAEGKVEDELLHVIDKYCADLIVIGSMSTKGLFGSLFNKPSENIIGKTRIPVMVIPNDLSLECTPDF